MALAAASCPSLHELEGLCELCGEICDSTFDELNAIACTFEGCPSPTIYHQHCIETYLKSIRLDKQRKTGFQCPRGCGKGSKSDKPCRGRVTKSHPIHARNDSSKKRRKAKMPDPAPPAVASAAPCKKEKENDNDKEKDQVPPLPNSKLSKLEKDKEKVDQKKSSTTPKPLLLNRASTFPSSCDGLGRNSGVASHSISGSSSSNVISNGGTKLLTREATVAAIVAARSEIAASKGGGAMKSGLELCGRLDRNLASSETGSTQSLDSDEEKARRVALIQHLKQIGASGQGIGAVPVVNAWATGRPRNGDPSNAFGQKELRPPSPLFPSPTPAQDSRPVTPLTPPSCSSAPGQPAIPDVIGLATAEDDLDARRARARTKNEKKHLQRAAKAREKREAEEAAAAAAAAARVVQDESQPKPCQLVERQPSVALGIGLRSWSQSCVFAICEKKSFTLAKQLQDLGFADWQSILAVRICGSDLHQCIDWLLRNGSTMRADMPVQSQERLDITAELKVLEEILHSKGFMQNQVEAAVVSTRGDIEAAINHLRSKTSMSKPPVLEEERRPVQAQGIEGVSYEMASAKGSGLGTGVWESVLNGTTNGRPFSPFSGSTTSYESESGGFGHFGSGFISDLARYNALLGMDGTQAPRQDMKPINDGGLPKSGGFSPASLGHSEQFDSFSSGLLHSGMFSEPTVSTVTSVAAAVLNDTFGFDEQVIAQLTEAIAANDSPFAATVNAAASLDGIWSYQPPQASKSMGSNGFTNYSGSDPSSFYTSTNVMLNGQSYFQSGISAFSKGTSPVLPEASRNTAKNGYSVSSGVQQWGHHSVKVVDEAEEQEILMSQLLSQLLV